MKNQFPKEKVKKIATLKNEGPTVINKMEIQTKSEKNPCY